MADYGGYNMGFDPGFDGNGGAGFMAGSSPQQGGADKKGVARYKSPLTPLTFKQLISAKHENSGDQHYKIDGKDIVNGRIIARVIEMQDDAAQCKFTLTDGTTPPVELSLFYSQMDAAVWSTRRPLLDGALAEVTFQCSARNNMNATTVLDVRPVPHGDALTHHILSALNTHLANTRPPLPRGGQQHAGAGAGAGGSSHYAAANAAIAAEATMGGMLAASHHGGAAGGDIEYLLSLYRQHASDSEEGIAMRDIAAIAQREGRRPQLTLEAVTRLSEQLMLEGHIYSTIDEQHYKPTS